ncbi:hypothetical protein SDC9_160273 [bioreactor metagenome]|uniref:Uncharacterized protein n=1 Tax=bioreactor metagenome TaxID=1076179 RepID=A0A645FL70_9ZZZZ
MALFNFYRSRNIFDIFAHVFLCKIRVKAYACHCIVYSIRFTGSFTEDAAYLSSVHKYVIGPFKSCIDLVLVFEHRSDSKTCGKVEKLYIAGPELGPDQNRKEEVF